MPLISPEEIRQLASIASAALEERRTTAPERTYPLAFMGDQSKYADSRSALQKAWTLATELLIPLLEEIKEKGIIPIELGEIIEHDPEGYKRHHHSQGSILVRPSNWTTIHYDTTGVSIPLGIKGIEGNEIRLRIFGETGDVFVEDPIYMHGSHRSISRKVGNGNEFGLGLLGLNEEPAADSMGGKIAAIGKAARRQLIETLVAAARGTDIPPPK